MRSIVVIGVFLSIPVSSKAMSLAEKQGIFQAQLINDMAIATVALMTDMPESRVRELQIIHAEEIQQIYKLTADQDNEQRFEARLRNGDRLVTRFWKDKKCYSCYRAVAYGNDNTALLMLNKLYFSSLEKVWQEQQEQKRRKELAFG